MHLGVLVYTLYMHLGVYIICVFNSSYLGIYTLTSIYASGRMHASGRIHASGRAVYMHLGVQYTCIWAYAYTCIWACSIQAFGRIHMHLALYWSFIPFINISHLLLKFHTFIEFVSFIGVSYLLFEICIIYSSFVTFKFGSRKQYSMESYKKYIRAFQNKYNFISLRRSILAQFHPDTLRIVQAICDILATVPKFKLFDCTESRCKVKKSYFLELSLKIP